jgi:hypothetical protein
LNVKINSNNYSTHEADSEITIIPATKAILSKTIRLIQNTKKHIDLIYTWKRYKYFFPFIEEPILETLERGAKLRLVIEQPSDTKATYEHMAFFGKVNDKGSSIKFTFEQPSAIVIICDRKYLLMPVISDASPFESPVLMSNNKCLVYMATTYFEKIWRKSKKIRVNNYEYLLKS